MTKEQIRAEFIENKGKDYQWLNAIESLQNILGFTPREAEAIVEEWDDGEES